MAATRFLVLLFVTLCVAGPVQAQNDSRQLPVFDAHIHYNLDEGRPVSVEEVFELWRRAGIRGGLLTSRPNDGTRELLEKAPKEFKTVAFARPYIVRGDVQTWFRDPAIYAMTERELARGIYIGIGEFHIFGRDADGDGFARFVRLAKQHGLWLHAHSDASAVRKLFALGPTLRIVWAHAGMSEPPEVVGAMLERYPALIAELSYRSVM